MTGNQTVAANLRLIRRANDITQDDLADRLAALLGKRPSKATVSAWERTADPSRRQCRFDADLIVALAAALDCPLSWLLGDAP